MKNTALLFFTALVLTACSGSSEPVVPEEKIPPLPYLGETEIDGTDTLYHTIPTYMLMAQDSTLFTNERVAGKIHVANFFFTSCPSICPAMIEQMKRLQENTKDIEEIIFLSHTIDPVRDTIPRLLEYIAERNLDTRNWFFLYGDKEYMHDLGQDGYIINAMEDQKADGGFLHSEYFVLVDREGHIRAMYDGTKTEEVDKMEADIRKLLKEYAN